MQTTRRKRFWADVERTMTTPEAQSDLAAEASSLDGTLSDGLEP